jgi:hypothetical protein
MENVVGRGIQVLIPPDSGLRPSARPGWDGAPYAFMRRVLSTDHGKALYPQTPRHDRAGVRADEVQPTPRPLLTPRKIGRQVRVAAVRRQRQPAQAPQQQDSRHPAASVSTAGDAISITRRSLSSSAATGTRSKWRLRRTATRLVEAWLPPASSAAATSAVGPVSLRGPPLAGRLYSGSRTQ